MPRLHPIFANFTAGEFSPRLYGRTDFPKYHSAAKSLLNMISLPQGPTRRRPGLHFALECRKSANLSRIVNFEFSTIQAYIIEFSGSGFIRFFKSGGILTLATTAITNVVNNGAGLYRVTSTAHGLATNDPAFISGVLGTPGANGSWFVTVIDANTFDLQGSAFAGTYTSGGTVAKIVEIAHPYAEADLAALKFAQSADTLYIFHSSYAPRKLIRLSATSWTLVTVTFNPPPSFEGGDTSSINTSLTLGALSGNGVALTLGAALLYDADVGRQIQVGINGINGRATIKTITGVAPASAGTVDITITFTSLTAAAGGWTLEGSPNATITPGAKGPKGSVQTFTLSTPANGFRSTDVGRVLRVNKGVALITAFTSISVVSALITTPLFDTTGQIGGSWSIESPEWSTARGFPGTGSFHQQRLITGASAQKPQTFWGSVSGDIENLGASPDDSGGFAFTIASVKVDAIKWILAGRSLMIGTISGEYNVTGSQNSPAITPTAIDVRPTTAFGSSATVFPTPVGNVILYVDRSGKEVRELTYDFTTDAFVAPNMLLLADHLTADVESNQITQIAYQRKPFSALWCVRNDGVMLRMGYERAENVVGWTRHITGAAGDASDAKFESVAVIPHWNGGRDSVWTVVKRTIQGATKRYIEYFDDVGGSFYSLLFVDAGLTYSGPAATVFTGLQHLEGQTVDILSDGSVVAPQVVTGGQVTFPTGTPGGANVEIGLHYDSILESLRPEVTNVQGTAQGLMKHWAEIIVRFDKTLGAEVGDGSVEGGVETVDFRKSTDPMDTAIPLFTGDKKVKHVGRDPDATVLIKQKLPLPMTIIGIYGILAVGA